MDAIRRLLNDPTLGKIIVAIIGLIVLFTIVRIIRRALTRYVDDPVTRYRARKLLTLTWYVLVLLFLSLVFRTRLAGLTIFFGVAGVGIAVALQGVIISVAGWLTITFGGVYRAGDRIQLAGIKGDVIDVSILRTTIMEIGEWVHADLYSGRIVHIANSFVFRDPVFNFSGDFPFLWDEISIPVKYGSDYALAREILTRIVNETVAEYTAQAREDWGRMLLRFRIERATVEPTTTLRATDNWVEFTTRYIADYKKRRATMDKIFTRVLDEFSQTQGRVQIASATFEITDLPNLSIRLTNDSGLPGTDAAQRNKEGS